MTDRCATPISDETLLEYWAGELASDEADRIEAHLFACGDCAKRLEAVASIGTGLASLVRRGRVSGIVSRALVNRMQRDGVYVRQYALASGETVPCTVFPGDDLVVASLRADFSGVQAVTLSVTGPDSSPMSELDDVPVSRSEGEVLWALPGAVVRQMPSTRLQLTLTSTGAMPAVLGEYVLEHTAADLSSG
jgi:hypothetical protein